VGRGRYLRLATEHVEQQDHPLLTAVCLKDRPDAGHRAEAAAFMTVYIE